MTAPNPDHPQLGTPWYSLHYTCVMEPGEAKLPRAPSSEARC
ncbi:hypothetical protein [Paracoccus broussonetiae]|nr:hypothetical protein [Paracoccus sp. CPCC 101403]